MQIIKKVLDKKENGVILPLKSKKNENYFPQDLGAVCLFTSCLSLIPILPIKKQGEKNK